MRSDQLELKSGVRHVHTEVTTVTALGEGPRVAAYFVFCHKHMTTSLKLAGIAVVMAAK